MKRLFSDQKGFTLVEVIISIAILSLASVVILRLFITSVELNTRSRHSDIASVVATNTLEVLRQYDSGERLMGAFEAMMPTDSGYEMTLALNEDFSGSGINFTGDDDSAGSVMYELSLDLTETDKPGLYDVSVEIRSLEDSTILVAYTTKHYMKMEVGSSD